VAAVTLEARLSKKDELRILCGACQKTIAFVRELLDERGDRSRHILLPEGWAQASDHVWQLSGHALRQLQRGHHITNARRPESVRRLSEKIASTPWPTPSGSVTLPHLKHAVRVGQLLTVLPAELRCSFPRCGQRQMLDPAVLRVAPADPGRGNPTLVSPFHGAASFDYIETPRYRHSDPRAAYSPKRELEIGKRRLLERWAETGGPT
jgi:hypothetical protein